MEIKPEIHPTANIIVVGAGGGGSNAINRMIKANLEGISFVAVNTDSQALHYSKAHEKIHIGQKTTRGLGAGSNSEIGKKAAEENRQEIKKQLDGSDMVFITCGLGGGTGSGASPVIAEIAKECGALSVGVVTMPFSFEGQKRMNVAQAAYDELKEKVDTLITIPNDKLLSLIDRKTSIIDAFEVVDDVLLQGVQGIADLITIHGMINVDFADVRTIMHNAGSALMGIGYGTGENRAVEAAKSAVDSPLLDLSIQGAKGILINITGGTDLSMFEVDEAAKIITEASDPEANIIFGAVVDDTSVGEVKITVIATGFETKDITQSGGIGKSSSASRSPYISKAMPQRTNYFGGSGHGAGQSTGTGLGSATSPGGSKLSVPHLGEARDTKSMPLTRKNVPEAEGGDDELDVPAFIRKKMQ